ncbi:MAG: M1 family peptidase, partial [Bacteroidetes bacterium]
MLKFFFILHFSFCIVLFSQSLSPRIANYDIDVRLDADKKTLHGKETLLWFNKSSDVITELQFHLYMNGFRNSQSTFMKESKGRLRGEKMEKDGWGFIEIKKISLQTGEDITATLQFIQPDDGNTEDKTVFRLPLYTPLNPGDSIVLHIEFDEKLPTPPFARTGAKEEFIFAGQWFPKIGVYIDRAWNCHQFHANSEFFADFGVYDVRITVPEKNIVGATGLEYHKKNNGDGTATHCYRAEDVHDFAWTTSPEYIEVVGKEQDVNIRILMQPDRIGQGERHLDAAKLSVRYFQNWYGDYPFPNLTVVDPRRGAMGVGGMEYPTLITAGTGYGLPDGVRLVELAIIHEFGHNYWYHLLASNEFEESWLDEGINTYSEIQIMQDAYGSGDAINFLGLKMNDLQLQRGQYITVSNTDPTVRKAWEYSPGGYGVNSYSKPGLILTTLHNYIGKEMMHTVMRTYFERWKFKHPKSQDFVNVVNDVTGKDFNWFFDQALYSNKRIDYSVERISSNEVIKKEGFDYDVSDEHIKTQQGRNDDSIENTQSIWYESEALIRRNGDFKVPVEIEVVFENGERLREQWDGQELWTKIRWTKPSRLQSVTVDPERKIPLDINYTNNSKTLESQNAGINRTAFSLMF